MFPGPVDAGVHGGEAKPQERIEIPIERELPGAVEIGARHRGFLAHDNLERTTLWREPCDQPQPDVKPDAGRVNGRPNLPGCPLHQMGCSWAD
jgi:hypothetical protein